MPYNTRMITSEQALLCEAAQLVNYESIASEASRVTPKFYNTNAGNTPASASVASASASNGTAYGGTSSSFRAVQDSNAFRATNTGGSP